MRASLGVPFIDSMLSPKDYSGLVWLSSHVCPWDDVGLRKADYGLPQPLFLIVESLHWFAQAVRTGVWTYYEATPISRQRIMWESLRGLAPAGFAGNYAKGMRSWRDVAIMEELDAWMNEHDDQNTAWLWQLVADNRSLIYELIA